MSRHRILTPEEVAAFDQFQREQDALVRQRLATRRQSDLERIVRALAEWDPVGEAHDGGEYCTVCDGGDGAHTSECPWRLAVEWVGAHPAAPSGV